MKCPGEPSHEISASAQRASRSSTANRWPVGPAGDHAVSASPGRCPGLREPLPLRGGFATSPGRNKTGSNKHAMPMEVLAARLYPLSRGEGTQLP